MNEIDINGYIDNELYILIPVLYVLGVIIKKSRIKDSAIPFILGAAGVVLAVIYKLAVHTPGSMSEALSAVFAGLTQGILCAAASVYANNIKKQATTKKEDSEDTDNEKDA